MAKTPKPLTVWVSPDLEQEPSIQDLIRKGNTVRGLIPPAGTAYVSEDLETHPLMHTLRESGITVTVMKEEPDLIFSRTSWRVVKGLEKLLPLAVSAARKVKYPKGEPSE